jgi:hypothetical protein
VSPSWRNVLRIALSPERVTLVRLGKGLRPRVTDKRVETCMPVEGETWQTAITALKKLLDKQTGAVATVVLSSHFARYVTVPWSDDVSGDEELTALARHRYSQVYGTAANWEVRVSAADYAAPMLASGMEQGLLGALQQSCAQAGVRLDSVQPALMAAFNRWRGELPQDGGWFGIAESGYLTLALAKNGGWHGVQSRRLDGALGEVLPVVLEQERLLASLDSVPQYALVYAPEQAGLTPAAGKWSIRALKLPRQDGFSPLADGLFGLAMCGGK